MIDSTRNLGDRNLEDYPPKNCHAETVHVTLFVNKSTEIMIQHGALGVPVILCYRACLLEHPPAPPYPKISGIIHRIFMYHPEIMLY